MLPRENFEIWSSFKAMLYRCRHKFMKFTDRLCLKTDNYQFWIYLPTILKKWGVTPPTPPAWYTPKQDASHRKF
jgi:hypothetical protein